MNFADGKWKHGSTPKQSRQVITNGVPGTAMMSFKERFSEQEILALAKYVRAFDKTHKAAPAKAKSRLPSRSRQRESLPHDRPLRLTFPRPTERPMAQLNVALIGYAFMGRAHSNAYRQVSPVLLAKH